MADHPLMKLHRAFKGDTKRMAFLMKELGGPKSFGQAMKKVAFDPGKLEAASRNSRKKASADREAKVKEENRAYDGQARELAQEECDKSAIKHEDVKKLVTQWLKLQQEYKVRNFDHPDAAPDLSFLTMAPDSNDPDESAPPNLAEILKEMMGQEPIVIFSQKIDNFLRGVSFVRLGINESSDEFQNGLAKLDEMEKKAKEMAGDLDKIYSQGVPKSHKKLFARGGKAPSKEQLAEIIDEMEDTENKRQT